MNRGVQRGNIVCDDHDRGEWLRLLGRAAGRCRWRVFAWALLDNHFHLFLRTPLPNLSAGMHALESGYATLFNRRHGRSGVLFEGRFRAVAVQNESHAWELSRFVERCRRHVDAIQRAPTLDELTAIVQEVFGVPPEVLSDAGRHHNLARDAAILLARELVPENLDALAARFGAGTRSAITAAARRAAQRADCEPAYAELLKQAKRGIAGSQESHST